MVHGAGLLYTTLLSFPISLQGNWSVWFMGQVCYILRYCLFLHLYRVTGLYGSWGRFAIYYATVFVLHFIGEIMAVGVMGVFNNPQIANTTSALILSASVLIATGFLRFV